jgi:shikimate kinase
MNIVLIGYRGSGKSTVARILQEKTGMKSVSSDAMIEERAGMTITEFVKENGWDAFRELEETIIKEISTMDGIIVDTGGGVVLRENNIKLLKKNGRIFFLNADAKKLAERIKKETTRPSLLQGKEPWEEVEEVLKIRLPLYKKAADYVVDTGNSTPEDVAEKIINLFKNI